MERVSPLKEGLSEIPRPNWVEIDLDALAGNLKRLKESAGLSELLLPVKADAYGHGVLPCAAAASISGGATMLGVAHLFEAVDLRNWGIRTPVLVLGPATVEEFPLYVEHGVTPTIEDPALAEAFDAWLGERGLTAAYHLKINTGMNRHGLRFDDFEGLKRFEALKRAVMEGVYSHLACADDFSSGFTDVQYERFQNAVSRLAKRPRLVHIGASSGLLRHPEWNVDMARPGLASYGCSPFDGKSADELGLKPVLKLFATVRIVHVVKAGDSVSYGLRWTAEKDTKVALVAVGYGDGFRRNPPAGAYVRIRGKKCRILGTVCMDATVVDVSGLDDVRPGDVVTIIDGEEDSALSAESIAAGHRTIPYEITCDLARRLFHVFVWKGRRWNWTDLAAELRSSAV